MRNEHSYTVGEKSRAGFEQATLVHMRCICIDERPHCIVKTEKNETRKIAHGGYEKKSAEKVVWWKKWSGGKFIQINVCFHSTCDQS